MLHVRNHEFTPDSLGRCTFRNCLYVRNASVHVMPESEDDEVEVVFIPALEAWDQFSSVVRKTIADKSQGYGDAWKDQGSMGNLARVLSKASRLRNLCWGDKELEVGIEPVEDTLIDLAALAAFMMKNVEEGNRWG